MTPEQNLARLALVIPPAPKPVAVYRPVVVVQGLAYVSGHGPVRTDGSLITGRVGPDLGIGARSAVGMGPRPGNIAGEIEAIFELSPA